MKTKQKIQDRIKELTPAFELAEDSYFASVQEKQEGGDVYEAGFIKIESEYEVLKKEIDALEWVLNK